MHPHVPYFDRLVDRARDEHLLLIIKGHLVGEGKGFME